MRHHRRGRNPDANKLIIYHNPTGAATFDPTITLSQAGTVIWQTEAGTTVTTGTNHALSYTPTAGAKVCKVTVLAGLQAVTDIDGNSDAVLSIRNLSKCKSLKTVYLWGNNSIQLQLSDISPANIVSVGVGSSTGITGNLSQLSRGTTLINLIYCPSVLGSLLDLPATLTQAYLYQSIGISPASIAHLVSIRDLRIYSMGWTTQQNTDVLLSAWGTRANYTYASGIQLKISAPTGTPGTEPPADGVSNDDWSWNAGTSKHEPLTGYAAIFALGNDIYAEGYKTWSVTIV